MLFIALKQEIDVQYNKNKQLTGFHLIGNGNGNEMHQSFLKKLNGIYYKLQITWNLT